MVSDFESRKSVLAKEYEDIKWIENSGLDEDKLKEKIFKIESKCYPLCITKAKTFEMIVSKAMLAVDKDDIFQEKIFGRGLMNERTYSREAAVKEKYLKEETIEMSRAYDIYGAYIGHSDYGHTSPDSLFLVNEGIEGLRLRLEKYASRYNLSQKQKDFYEACRISLNALSIAALRLADAIEPYNIKNARCLRKIANGKPGNIYEAMQLIILYFFMHEYICGTRVRTLGRLDVMLYPFYKNDIETGVYSKAEVKELLKFFIYKFYVAEVPFGLPLCIGGLSPGGEEVTNEFSYLFVETINELNVHSPKTHIRVSDKTPRDFVKLVLSCIRGGNSSFVLVNDAVSTEALKRVGIDEKDALDYVPIGCYEPAVWGKEIGCTGNGGVSIPKAVELALTKGRDFVTGDLVGFETGVVTSYEDFISAIKKQLKYMTDKTVDYIKKIEGYYYLINPDPLLSVQYEESLCRGVDVFEGGALYNNTSLYYWSIASAVDMVCAVKKLVFEDNKYTLDELCRMLKCNWEGYEKERVKFLRLKEKYGNNNPVADTVAKELADYSASLVNGIPNGRGGVFKASLFTIDRCFELGKKMWATPDGRKAGEPLSKNLCAVTGMDKKGITSLINSVTIFDHAAYPNGSVLDIVLHPSAVSGDDGLEAFYGIIMTYFKKGGFAIHGNIFDAEVLKKARANPEKYANLQVRVCGWNAYFVNLSPEEQSAFIAQAEVGEGV